MEKKTRIKDLKRMLSLCQTVNGFMRSSMIFDKYDINNTIVEIQEEIEKLEESMKNESNECNSKSCIGCEYFLRTVTLPQMRVDISCKRIGRSKMVDHEHKATPKDFYEEETKE